MQETKLKQLVQENEQKQAQLQKEYDKINRRKDKIVEKFEAKQERFVYYNYEAMYSTEER